MSKITDIVEGWTNVVFKNPEIEKEALRKAKICDGCEYSSDGTILDFEGDQVVEAKGYCKDCYCPFVALLRSPNKKCNQNKW